MTFNRFAGYACNGGMPIEKATKPKVRNERRKPVDEDDGDKIIPSVDKGHTMTDPFQAIIEKQARAVQAQLGCSYEQAFVKAYTDPANASIRDAAATEHLARGHDAMFGYSIATPVKKSRSPEDDKEDFVKAAIDNRGPFHEKLHQMALDHSERHGLSYQQSYTRLFTSPENVQIRAGIAAEAGIRTLTLEEAKALAPAKPFTSYTSPGHDERDTANLGREGSGGQDF